MHITNLHWFSLINLTGKQSQTSSYSHIYFSCATHSS